MLCARLGALWRKAGSPPAWTCSEPLILEVRRSFPKVRRGEGTTFGVLQRHLPSQRSMANPVCSLPASSLRCRFSPSLKMEGVGGAFCDGKAHGEGGRGAAMRPQLRVFARKNAPVGAGVSQSIFALLLAPALSLPAVVPPFADGWRVRVPLTGAQSIRRGRGNAAPSVLAPGRLLLGDLQGRPRVL